MDNLTAFGLNEPSLLDIIFVNIHPVYLVNIRKTCKLFHDRVKNIIPQLYQKWVVNIPLNKIRKDTQKWKFKELITCSLIMTPVPESMKLTRRDRILVNALLKRYPEDECLQYVDSKVNVSYTGKFFTTTEVLFLAYKYGYKSIVNSYANELWSLHPRLFSCLFEGTVFELHDDDALSEVMEELLTHPHISIDEYMHLLKICLNEETGTNNDFILGLEAVEFDEDEGNAYYLIGYFLALHVERNKLMTYLTDMEIRANIPSNKANYQFYNNFTIDSYSNLESITNLRGYASCLSIYNPQKYVEVMGNKSVFDQKITHPYYYRVRNLE